MENTDLSYTARETAINALKHVIDLLENDVPMIYDQVTSQLPHHPSESRHGFWVSGAEEIMCKNRETAGILADFFEDAGLDIMHTFYYDDPERDGLNYGWWAVYVDGQ